MRTRLVAGVAVAIATGCVPAAHAQSPADFALNHQMAKQRGVDQQANPAYQQAFAPQLAEFAQTQDVTGDILIDPFRLNWAPARGDHRSVTIVNRYGVPLRADLLSPSKPKRRLPAVLVLTGGAGGQKGLRGLTQGLAEAGYVVLAVEAQGDGTNPVTPADPDPATPENEACAPGAWQQPQEMGISEMGPCPGQDPAPEPGPADGTPLAGTPADPAFLPFLVGEATEEIDYDGISAQYERVKARKTFAAFDAVGWLLSSANPWRDRVDAGRIGITGHSLGAHGALLAGNGDPKKRFKAVVSWDGYGRLGTTAAPRVPTMFQHSETEDAAPHRALPADPDIRPGNRDAKRFADAGVATMAVTLGHSTHQEWNYIPASAINPLCAPFCNSSADGERVSLYYTRAWLDRWLKRSGDRTARRRAARRSRDRLLARAFDGSIDGSSIGQGTFAPTVGQNVPYRIEGERVRDALSFLYRSFTDFDGRECRDLRTGC